jgi:uncharacterized protein (DUF58 family)
VRSFGDRLRVALLAAHRDGLRGYGAASARRSDGYEFAELRGYVDGDDPRRIDWAATARAGALQTRVMLEERSLSLATAVDASGSMHTGRTRSNYELACEAAAAWYGAAHDDDRCAWIGARALVLRHTRGRAGADVCARERDVPGAPYDAALRLALAALPRGSRLLLASDFLDLERIRELVRACAERFVCTAVLLRDPWHAGLPLEGFVRLRDAETGASARLFVGRRARERYRIASAAREAAALATLRRTGCRPVLFAEGERADTVLAEAFGFG